MNASAGALALESQPFGWLRSAPAPARRALLAASIGWLFDGFDVMIYSMVLTALLADFGISKTTGGVLGSLTLLASAGGGVLFGMIADRYGRRTGLISSVLTYSLFTAACGLAQTVWQLAVCRFVLGLGMGGAWTTGAALVSETWPDRHRGKAVGLMQSAWAVGYGSAAALAAIVLPRYGWRAMFFIGALPALAAVWMHRGLNESAMWTDARTHGRASLGLIFSPAYRRVTLALVALSFCTLYAYWAFNFWVPAYLTLPVEQRGVGLDTSEVAGLLVVMNVGGWLGYVLYGYVSDRIGRRRSFVAYLIVAAVLVFAYGRARSATVLLLLGPVVAFFSTGYLSGFGAIIAELYPTTVRAAAGGFIFNIGRIGSAAAPLLIASLAQRSGFGIAFATTSAALVLAALTWLWIPETKGRTLQ
jgi:MFS family permease